MLNIAPVTARTVAPPTFPGSLRAHADAATALVDGERRVTYGELRERVDRRVAELDLGDRSVVVLTGSNSIEFVVTYLALLDARHVPLLATSGAHAERLIDAWRPAAAVAVDGTTVDIRRFAAEPPELHPDLALLLSTSGSTGSPKLVRLSQRNLLANAESIAAYLELGSGDVGITSLPLHYCYGLSVLHSHLLVGASVVVTDHSVVDPCFAAAMRDHEVTNLAGVPHTFEMLERAGAERIAVPSLRLLTQAGGRLAPDAVRRWVDRADAWGAAFFVMYGQTEATARMAYLPPHLARAHPGAIGVPIPGGDLRIEPFDGSGDTGELVYSGPNVMMGYADAAADLAAGPELDELRTGDLARFDAEAGVFELVGRRARFVKPFGLRIDLDEVESTLREVADPLAVAGDDEQISIVAPGADSALVRRSAAAATSLPAGRIRVVTDVEIPRTASGKPDYAAVTELAAGGESDGGGADAAVDPPAAVADVFASVLGLASVPRDRSFVELGGDSLGYVECSIRLEHAIGRLPDGWHLRPVGELAALADAGNERRRRLPQLDTTVLLRAVGICLVVATHMRLRHVPGGAHLMLGVVGYNVARFLTPIDRPIDRLRAGARTVGRVAIPTMLWVAIGAVVFGSYSLGTFLLVNNYVGPRSHAGDHWHFWFIEVFVHLVVLTALLLAVPAVRRVERRAPYAFALGLLAVVGLLRLEWADLGDWYNMRYRTHAVAFFFVLGWLVHRSNTPGRRLLTTVVAAVVVSGFFRNETREWLIAGGLIMLAWLPTIPFPRVGVRLAGVLAGASMWIYLSHFTFWPLLDHRLGLLREPAYVATLAVGVAIWQLAERAEPRIVDAVGRSARVARRAVEQRRRRPVALAT